MNKAGLQSLLSREGGVIMEVEEGGQNLSVGERQLICIVRAILRRAKLVIMDEATANIDLKTEMLV
jgi:ABC-type multidrug transport system fused ATPase/permease subunit